MNADDCRPGLYRYRATRGAPWQAVEIVRGADGWSVRINGWPTPDKPALDWLDHGWLKRHWPLWPIERAEFDRLMLAHQSAREGSPLASPDRPVDLRAASVRHRRG